MNCRTHESCAKKIKELEEQVSLLSDKLADTQLQNQLPFERKQNFTFNEYLLEANKIIIFVENDYLRN